MLVKGIQMDRSPMDQAAGLRRMVNPKPVKVIAVTSGKGGVGKTNVSVNLALALAGSGKNVMLMDADLGLANVDLLLGLRAQHNLSHVINGERTLEEIIIEGPEGLMIVPASSGTQMMSELSPTQHAGLIQAFSELNHNLDVLMIDTAAGISDGVVSFTRAAHEVLVVVCNEPTSLTDAYALIKVLSLEHGIRRFHIVANMVKGRQEGLELFAKLSTVTDRYLNVMLDFVGIVPLDDYLRTAVKKQRAVLQTYPRCPASMAFRALAEKIKSWPSPQQASGNLEFFVERLIQYSAVAGAE